MQQDSDKLQEKLVYVTWKIVEMLVKQFTCGKKLIETAIPRY